MSKFCVLPGQEPVRLASLSGHVVIIGEELREVPEQFHDEARAAGCLREEELELLKQRLLGGKAESLFTQPTKPLQSLTNLDDAEDGFHSPPGNNTQAADSERAEKIKAAVIEVINASNPNDIIASGAPKVEVLKEKLGFEVTVAERDTAFKEAQG